MGDVKTTINGTLQGTEDTGTSAGALEADIEESAEWAATLLLYNADKATETCVQTDEAATTQATENTMTNTVHAPM